jgi:hypothetical protein
VTRVLPEEKYAEHKFETGDNKQRVSKDLRYVHNAPPFAFTITYCIPDSQGLFIN